MSLSHIIDKDKLNSFAQQAIPPIKTAVGQLGTALGALSDEIDGIENGLGTAASKDVPTSGNASSTEVVMGNDTRLSDSRPASDVSAWAKANTKPSYTANEVGAIATTAKGANSGVAELDVNGKVPLTQLPSGIDDVVEGYYNTLDGKFYEESTYETEITGEISKVYVDLISNTLYRWNRSVFVSIGGSSLSLGTSHTDAYYGDYGQAAYNHSQVTTGNPHNVSASDVGLGNVGNFKAVSTVASQGLTSTEQSNARTNIGVGSVQDNLTSDSTTDSLSAKQGKELNTRLETVETFINNLGVAETTSF